MDLLIWMSVLPVIPFFLVYYLIYFRKKDRKQAFGLAMDVTTIFLVISVSALFNIIFHTGFGFYLILLLLLITAGLIGGAQNRWKGRVDGRKLLRAVWRLAFITMSLGYLVFAFFGIIQYIFNVL
ncbi:DUF3397 domain-containing protein [Paenibacillus dakarensis]|uniref:DUF3397 domain-containing protein n=1 Tax=Paenibacillus dakarensis TaxID=1527293 RepID=UPI0006D5719F|nr:DUF3397 domain-containing protein [Paenibacillus dakarensis]